MSTNTHRKKSIVYLLGTSVLTAMLMGCGLVAPTPFDPAEIQSRAQIDRLQMYENQEPITGPISFDEAAARALKYNLDYKLKLMEHALSSSLRDVSTYEMLPRLVTSAGYASRSNDSGGTSVGIQSGIVTLSPSTSQERDRHLADLGFSWNVLDFGVSYYRAHQKADQVLIAEERRRKVAQNVLQDVRNSYWRAAGAQKLIGRVDKLLIRVQSALQRAYQIERNDLMPRQEILSYQRTLLDAVNMLTLRRQDLELARAELRALMSVSPDVEFTLVDNIQEALPPVPTDVAGLEIMALERRPEIMEEWYRRRITENDIKAVTLSVFPNLSFDAGFHYDSNKYNYNADWLDMGVRLSWNIFKLAQLPALNRAHEQQTQTDDMRRLALSMAVITQVRVGVQRYALSLAELDFAKASAEVDRKLLKYAQATQDSEYQSELELIRAQARALLAEYQKYASYSNAQASWGRVYNSVGLDVLPEVVEGHDIKTLAAAIGQTREQWQKTVLNPSRTDTTTSSVVYQTEPQARITTGKKGQPIGHLREGTL